MKSTYLFILIMALSVSSMKSQNQYLNWLGHLGGVARDYVNDIYVDDSGYVYTTGQFTGNADLDPNPRTIEFHSFGKSDAFLNKFKSNGEHVWARQLGGDSADIGQCLVVDDSLNVYAAGVFEDSADVNPKKSEVHFIHSKGYRDIYFIKLNKEGRLVWAHSIGDIGYENVSSINLDDSANIYLSGTASGNVDFDFGPDTVFSSGSFLAKYSRNGEFKWVVSTNYGNIKTRVDNYGNSYSIGRFSDTVDFDPGPNVFNMDALNGNTYIRKLDRNAQLIWAKQYFGKNTNDIELSPSGLIAIAGSFDTYTDFDPGNGSHYLTPQKYDAYLLVLDQNGLFQWAINTGGGESDGASSVHFDDSSNIYYTGSFSDTVDFDPGPDTFFIRRFAYSPNIFISKLSHSGNFAWAISIGGVSGYPVMELNQANEIFTAGSFSGNPDFDPSQDTTLLISRGWNDIFILKLGEYLFDGLIENNFSLDMLAYPNPTLGNFTIDFQHTLKQVRIRIMNLQGEVCEEKYLYNTHKTNLEIQANSGLYFIEITSGENRAIFKIIKR